MNKYEQKWRNKSQDWRNKVIKGTENEPKSVLEKIRLCLIPIEGNVSHFNKKRLYELSNCGNSYNESDKLN